MSTTHSRAETTDPDAAVLYGLTAFQRDALTAVAGTDDPCGLDLKAHLEDAYGKTVQHGRLYPNLDTLVDKGLVEKGAKDQRTNLYRLTDRGRRVLESDVQWRRTQLGEVSE